jgi:exosortase
VRDYALLVGMMLLGGWLLRAPLTDMMSIGLNDEEQSHIFLAPVVALLLLYLRRTRLRYLALSPSFLGPAVILGGWLICWAGFHFGIQAAWHGGALLSLLGVVLSFTGVALLQLFAPVLIVLVFLIPVPGALRHGIALPLQYQATGVTHAVLELVGVGAVRSGNVLLINGQQVAVGEACNGMRMVFALSLVAYAFAFGRPLNNTLRVFVLLLSPFTAIACNVIRLVPTSLIFGYGSYESAVNFHDLAGWAMLPVALLILAAVVRLIEWMDFPVLTFRLANQ